jgi:hypothetical protein
VLHDANPSLGRIALAGPIDRRLFISDHERRLAAGRDEARGRRPRQRPIRGAACAIGLTRRDIGR